MFIATWNDTVLARGSDVIEVEARLYFRPDDVRHDYLRKSPDRSVCEWKGGEAEYFDIVIDNAMNRAAAWRYESLGPQAAALAGRFAFWRGVDVSWVGPGPTVRPGRIEPQAPNVARAFGAKSVVWKPSFIPPFQGGTVGDGFEGYLIASLNILVDVMATPPDAERPAAIAAAALRADHVAAWNADHPDEAYGYIAVWGSARPTPASIAALRNHAVVIALDDDRFTAAQHN